MQVEQTQEEQIQIGSTEIKEGLASILSNDQVFYNPIQTFNRDLSIAAIQTWFQLKMFKKYKLDSMEWMDLTKSTKNASSTIPNASSTIDNEPSITDNDNLQTTKDDIIEKEKYTILEALSASGLRSIRYAKELPCVSKIIANDFDFNAVQSIQKNVEHNQVQDIVQASHGNALKVMYEAIISGNKFDVIDLDPYGSAVPFIDAAVQAVAEDGLLCITCTDMAVLAGGQSEACWAKYGGMSLPNSPFCHELGLRILLQTIQASANRYKRVIEPLMSCSIDFYVRVFVRVRTSPCQVKMSASLTRLIYYCNHCCNFTTQQIGKCNQSVSEKGNPSFKFGPARGPVVGEKCIHCNNFYHIGGPMYGGAMHNRDFMNLIQKQIQVSDNQVYATYDRMRGMVNVIADELPDAPLYYSMSHLSNVLHCQTPPLEAIKSALLNAGFEISDTHCCAGAIKTNAPIKMFWDIFLQYCQEHTPLNPDKLNPKSPSFTIYHSEIGMKMDFTKHPKAISNAKRFKLVRYQANPTPHWGPKSKPKKQKSNHPSTLSIEE